MLQQAPASREQLREQIRQTVKEAQSAAKAAAEEAAQGRDPQVRVVVPPVGPFGTETGAPMVFQPEIPRGVENISIAFFVMVAAVIIGLPLMRAIARRIDKGTSTAAQIPAEVRQQLQQISQNVDAIAIEVERISEGQRFTTKMLADRTRDGTVVTPGSSSAP
jgi:hypothetical protein